MSALEGVLIGAVLAPLALSPPVRQYAGTLPRSARVAVLLFFSLLVAGHLARMDQRTFPFVVWWMYGVEKSPRGILYEQYSGLTASGALVPLYPSSAFPSLDQGRIVNPLRPRMRWLPQSQEARVEATMLLTAVARAVNRSRMDPVVTVIATRCELSADEWLRGVPFRCRENLRFDLSETAGR
jgi:hypothetical protein